MVDRMAEAEREITRYQQERERWINYTTDLQRIIEALCGNRKLPQPVSTARHHYNMAKEFLEARSLSRTSVVKVKDEPAPAAEAFESCPDCAGSGYSNHPDSGQVCYRCNGQGSCTRPPENRLREAAEKLVEACSGEVEEVFRAEIGSELKSLRAALAQGADDEADRLED